MAVNAVQTLTWSGASVNTETVTVGGKVYTFATAYANTDGLIVVGATAAIAAQSLYDAINLTPAALGVTVGAVTVANAQVRASAVTATTTVVQAVVPGTMGNLIVSTETCTNAAFGAATLAGGTGSAAVDLQNIINTMQMPAGVMQALRELCYDPAAV